MSGPKKHEARAVLELRRALGAAEAPLHRYEPVPGFSPHAYADDVHRFFRRACELGLAPDGDWRAWRDEAEAADLAALVRADHAALGRLAAAWSRLESEAPGTWARLLDAGLVMAWLDRLAALLAAAEPPPDPCDAAADALLAAHRDDFPVVADAPWSLTRTPAFPARWPPQPDDDCAYFVYGVTLGLGDRTVCDGVFVSNIVARIHVSPDGAHALWERLAERLGAGTVQGFEPMSAEEGERVDAQLKGPPRVSDVDALRARYAWYLRHNGVVVGRAAAIQPDVFEALGVEILRLH